MAYLFLKHPENLHCEAARLCALLIVIEKGYADVCFMPHQRERERERGLSPCFTYGTTMRFDN